MFRGIEGVSLFSEDPRELAEFYQKVIGLPQPNEGEVGESNEEMFWWELEGASFSIMHHNKVSGKNSQPDRVMINFEVDNIEKAVKTAEDSGAKKIQDTYHMEGYGYISTFEDSDGNYFQLVQVRPDEEAKEDDDDNDEDDSDED